MIRQARPCAPGRAVVRGVDVRSGGIVLRLLPKKGTRPATPVNCDQLRLAIITGIERTYHRPRGSSASAGSPVEYEMLYAEVTLAA